MPRLSDATLYGDAGYNWCHESWCHRARWCRDLPMPRLRDATVIVMPVYLMISFPPFPSLAVRVCVCVCFFFSFCCRLIQDAFAPRAEDPFAPRFRRCHAMMPPLSPLQVSKGVLEDIIYGLSNSSWTLSRLFLIIHMSSEVLIFDWSLWLLCFTFIVNIADLY